MFSQRQGGLLLLLLFIFTLAPSWRCNPTNQAHVIRLGSVFPADHTPLTVSLLYPDQFHDYDELQDEIMNLHALAPDLIDLEIIGQSFQGRNITCLRLTNEFETRQKAKTLIVAHHHGREQITIEMALRFIIRLLNNYGVDPELTRYIDTQEIYIIPSLNPDTLEYVVNQGNHWLRKNLRPFDNDNDGVSDEDGYEDVNGDGAISSFDVYSKIGGDLYYQYTYYEGIDDDVDGQTNEDPLGWVDLNRNYPTGFGNPGSSSDPLSPSHHGPAPFSEPETQVFRDFTSQHRFAMAYSLHSGINTTYFPSTNGVWRDPVLYTLIYNELDDLLPPWFNDADEYTSTVNRGVRAQLETGEFGLWQDWMYVGRGTDVPICFEVYRNASSLSPACINIVVDNENTLIEEWTGIYGHFNPVAAAIDGLWYELLPAFDYLLSMTPCLEVSLQTLQTLGPSISLSVGLSCLSPRLSTVEPIEFLADDNTLLYTTYGVITAGSSQTVTVLLPLGVIGPTNLIRIGNNYTGYVSLVMPIDPISTLIPIIAGISIAIVAVVIIIYLFRRSRS